MSRAAVRLALLLGVCSAGSSLSAQPSPGKSAKKPPAEPAAAKLDPSKLRAELESNDPSRMLAALEQIALAPAQAAELAPLVEALLRRGATSTVSVRALEVLGVLAQPTSSAAIAPYVRHRDALLRRAAVRALARTGGADAIKALRHCLRSSDRTVRAVAATGLGSLGASEAVPDLLRALDQNVPEAAESIGQLCDPQECRDFTSRLGKLPLDVMAAGIQPLLFRPPERMPDQEKVAVVGALQALGTREARRYLRSILDRWPEQGSAVVRNALLSALRGVEER